MNPYKQVEKELIWYFNHSDAAIGFKSSHASFVAAVYGVSATNSDPDPYTDGLLKQVKKIRQIRNIFYSLPLDSRRALEACYNLEYHFNYPPEIINIYGNKAGVTFFVIPFDTLDSFTKLCRKKKQRKLSPSEEIAMFNIGEDTRKLWNLIHEQYMTARQEYMNQMSAKK